MSDREQMRDDDGLRREGDRLVTEALSARPAVSVGAVTLATMTREEAPAVDVPHDLHETAMSRWRTPAPEPAPPASDREALGRLVREVWIAWAREQPNPKPSWLVPWEGLSEPDREVDRRIGERLAAEGERARPAPLTEGEARGWFDLEYNAWQRDEADTRDVRDIAAGIIARASRGDVPPEVRTKRPHRGSDRRDV